MTVSSLWEDSISVGCTDLDNQHKRLINIAGILEGEVTDEDIQQVLLNLILYVKIHFKYEEDVMQAVQYPDLEEHRELHKILVNKLDQLKHKYSVNQLETNDLENFIFDWLTGHILDADMKYCEYIPENFMLE